MLPRTPYAIVLGFFSLSLDLSRSLFRCKQFISAFETSIVSCVRKHVLRFFSFPFIAVIPRWHAHSDLEDKFPLSACER